MTTDGFRLENLQRAVRSWLPFLLYVLLPVALFGPALAEGTATFFAWGDAVEQSYAWVQKLTVALHHGYLPLWNANSHGGTSFAGEIQQGVFYPISLLVAWLFGSVSGLPLPVAEAWVAFHFVVGMVCFHLLARDLGASRTAATCGAMMFALLGPVAFRSVAQVGIFFGLVWMPLAVMLAYRFIRGGSFWYALAAGLVVGLQLIAGHISPPAHTMLAIAAFAVHALVTGTDRTPMLQRLAAGAALFGLGLVLISLPQLVLGWEYLRDVYRWVAADVAISSVRKVPASIFLTLHALTPSGLLSLVNPWQYSAPDANTLYVGLPAVALLILAFFRLRGPENTSLAVRKHLWLIWLAAGSTVVALGAYTPAAGLLYYLPLGTAIRSLARYMILFHLVCAILFTFVVDAGIRKGMFSRWLTRWPWWLWLTLVVLALWLAYFKYSPVIEPMGRQLLLTVALLAVLRWKPKWGSTAVGVSLVLSVLLVRNFYFPPLGGAMVPVTERYAVGPVTQFVLQQEQPGRVLLDDSASLPKNYGLVTGLQTKLGYSATYYRPYFDFLDQDWNLNSKVNDALNVRWVISKAPQDLPLILAEPETGLKLYERASAYPRAWLVSQMEKLGGADFDAGLVTITEYADQHIGVRLQTQGDDVLFLSELDYPGWYAWVDGSPVPIVKGAVPGLKPLFRTVAISGAGFHHVEFRYQPWRGRLGIF